MQLISRDIVKDILGGERVLDSDKRDYGNLLIFAGKEGMAGAAILAARAALRSGAGLVKVATPKVNYPMLQVAIPEAICVNQEDAAENLQTYTGIAFGPGMGVNERTESLLNCIIDFGLAHPETPIILDADGLNVLAALDRPLSENFIITPHKREAARLLREESPDAATSTEVNSSEDSAAVLEQREGVCLRLIRKYKAVTLLKGNETLIGSVCIENEINTYKLWKNTTGNPGMATAGSGDVLTGIIGSLIAQGLSPLKGAISGTFIHGLSGDLAKEKLGERSIIASDIINELPQAFMRI